MKQLLSGWTMMRFLRLGMGIYALVQSVIDHEPVLAFAGVLLTAMAVFNVGCCGVNGCSTSVKPAGKFLGRTDNISFEEIK